ncbi:hypothetical protein PUMCH_001553 [Australozyma saopauloensis]|uniref:Mannosyltransferase n=1 Tax=Australozyma saopauloensis TaxID=291208 RepID=A0AAX4H9A9_9ASCO|nr:hypothetical protein PUMCH_001553 [[Candida] saopauloensis]
MFLLNWRNIYICSIGLRFFFALANSYIHPDEHFQAFEPLAALIFGYNTHLPWEFTDAYPARSMAPLFIVYYPMMLLACLAGLGPMQTWYLVRLTLMVVSWMVTDWVLYKMLPTKQERIKAIFFVLTSYVLLVYQSHTFSNSVETVLVMAVVYLINELRFLRSIPKEQYSVAEVAYAGLLIGALSAFGIFNRVSFPAFVLLPAIFLVGAALQWPVLIPCLFGAFSFMTFCCVIVDTAFYQNIPVMTVLHELGKRSWIGYTITPLNNLVYNTLVDNLSTHGLHPYYTHVLINLPQLLGPGLLFLFAKGKNVYWKTTPFLSAAGGALFLSLIPHQELRFLVPTVPLLCACFDLTVFERFTKLNVSLVSWTLNLWLLFNAALAVLMGVFHQGGVVPAMDYFHHMDSQPASIVFWRTYMAPTWMLGDTNNSTQFAVINDDSALLVLDKSKLYTLVDTMGMLFETLQDVLNQSKQALKELYVVMPIASFSELFSEKQYELVWSYRYHMDLDHLDFSNLGSLQPGLGIYRSLL